MKLIVHRVESISAENGENVVPVLNIHALDGDAKRGNPEREALHVVLRGALATEIEGAVKRGDEIEFVLKKKG